MYASEASFNEEEHDGTPFHDQSLVEEAYDYHGREEQEDSEDDQIVDSGLPYQPIPNAQRSRDAEQEMDDLYRIPVNRKPCRRSPADGLVVTSPRSPEERDDGASEEDEDEGYGMSDVEFQEVLLTELGLNRTSQRGEAQVLPVQVLSHQGWYGEAETKSIKWGPEELSLIHI